MFGDSPWDYMSEVEKTARQKEWNKRDKLARAKAKQQMLKNLRHYTDAELLAELRRRDKVRKVKNG